VHDARCHIHQVWIFAAPAASTLGNFDIALDREGWSRQPGSTSRAVRQWRRAGSSLEVIVVSRDGGSGAVLHLIAPIHRATSPRPSFFDTSLAGKSIAGTSFARSFFGPSRSSVITEPPCKDL
jgi:hypothetical protein